jgi:hypothetical protein
MADIIAKPTRQDIQEIERAAETTVRFPTTWKSTLEKDKVFKSLFGCNSFIIAAIWNEIGILIDHDVYRKHLLWALIYLKVYATEFVHCCLVGWPSAKTFREKSWHVIECIADIKAKIIKVENRFIRAPKDRDGLSLLTFDCTDCMTDEPYPFNKSMKSCKFNGPGFKYGVAIAIFSDNICSSDGPKPASYYEGKVFSEGVGRRIPDNEPVEVDAGIKGDDRLMPPQAALNTTERKQKSIYRGRQETIFGKMKQFNILNAPFRFSASDFEKIKYKHGACFDAVIVITQLKLMIGGDILFRGGEFDVRYHMP